LQGQGEIRTDEAGPTGDQIAGWFQNARS
jgi:hypothetical protein